MKDILLLIFLCLSIIFIHQAYINSYIQSSDLTYFVNQLRDYSTLLTATAALLAVLATLYISVWRTILRKPKLTLYFLENRDPYLQQLGFGPFPQLIVLDGLPVNILNPGFNARVKVFNNGKTTATKVQARIEKIEIYDHGQLVMKRHYHPTAIKWSGEPDWNPKDIVPKSFFFLDLFHSINESSNEIFAFNEKRLKKYHIYFDEGILKETIQKDIRPSEKIYWNVWIDISYDRGVPKKYDQQGDIILYFIISGENCDPLKFQAVINWSYQNWNRSNIRIKVDNKYINYEEVK